MELVIAEKPSVAQSIAAVLGATQRRTDIWKAMSIWYHGVWDIW